MIIVKVKHEIGLDPEFLDIAVSDNKLDLFFLLNILENNSFVIWYEIMRSTRTSFDVITNLKEGFGFSQEHFPKLKQK